MSSRPHGARRHGPHKAITIAAGRLLAAVVLFSLVLAGAWVSRAIAAPAAPPAAAGEALAASPPRPPLPADITGATVIEYDGRTQQYTFRGARVVIVRGVQRLEAPEVLYSAAGRRVALPRGGSVSTPVMEVSADRMLADLVSRHVEAEGRAAGRFLDKGIWTSLAAARMVADDQPDRRRADATGNVVAIRQDQELHGDHIMYDWGTSHGTVEGHALLRRGQDSLQADRIDADLDALEAQATGHVLLDRAAQDIHASAEEAAYSARTNTAILSGHPLVTRGRDSLTADQITVRLAEDLVTADGHAQVVGYSRGIGP